MINLYDIVYGLGVGLSSPYWLLKATARQKVLTALKERMGHVTARDSSSTAILIHAVSLGEINATSELVKLLKKSRPDVQIIVSTTTKTGYARGQQLYPPTSGTQLIWFPLDFTSAITRVLDSVRPSIVVLMELELWPNFLRQCQKRHIPALLINGRMTPPAFKRYKRVKPIAAKMLKRLAVICAQDENYASRFKSLGAPADRVHVTGTMKFDTAQVADHVDGDQQLAREVGLPTKVDLTLIAGGGSPGPSSSKEPGLPPPAITDAREIVWVCGSTGPEEEAILLNVYRSLVPDFPKLRLAIIPRKPERFDEVADLIQKSGFSLLRRSRSNQTSATENPVILGDTMGELRKFYSLAHVVFVGRSLVDLGPRQHGSDMIEPAALAKPIAVGPWTHNFADSMQRLKKANAIEEVIDGPALEKIIRRWLHDPAAATAIGQRAQKVVVENQGATARHTDAILGFLTKT